MLDPTGFDFLLTTRYDFRGERQNSLVGRAMSEVGIEDIPARVEAISLLTGFHDRSSPFERPAFATLLRLDVSENGWQSKLSKSCNDITTPLL